MLTEIEHEGTKKCSVVCPDATQSECNGAVAWGIRNSLQEADMITLMPCAEPAIKSSKSACFSANPTTQSEHRTLNWEEADFFYMPMYVNLLVWPVFGWADGPWWGAVWGALQVC